MTSCTGNLRPSSAVVILFKPTILDTGPPALLGEKLSRSIEPIVSHSGKYKGHSSVAFASLNL